MIKEAAMAAWAQGMKSVYERYVNNGKNGTFSQP
jgi:hypothetical protein